MCTILKTARDYSELWGGPGVGSPSTESPRVGDGGDGVLTSVSIAQEIILAAPLLKAKAQETECLEFLRRK